MIRHSGSIKTRRLFYNAFTSLIDSMSPTNPVPERRLVTRPADSGASVRVAGVGLARCLRYF